MTARTLQLQQLSKKPVCCANRFVQSIIQSICDYEQSIFFLCKVIVSVVFLFRMRLHVHCNCKNRLTSRAVVGIASCKASSDPYAIMNNQYFFLCKIIVSAVFLFRKRS